MDLSCSLSVRFAAAENTDVFQCRHRPILIAYVFVGVGNDLGNNATAEAARGVPDGTRI